MDRDLLRRIYQWVRRSQWTYNARFQSEVLRRKGRNERAQLIRSAFDWTVCSEPLARLRRTRAYGYSIGECVVVGSNHVQVWPKCTLELRSKGSIVRYCLFPNVGKRIVV